MFKLAKAVMGLLLVGTEWEPAAVPAGAELYTMEEGNFVGVYARAGEEVYSVSDVFPDAVGRELAYLSTPPSGDEALDPREGLKLGSGDYVVLTKHSLYTLRVRPDGVVAKKQCSTMDNPFAPTGCAVRGNSARVVKNRLVVVGDGRVQLETSNIGELRIAPR